MAGLGSARVRTAVSHIQDAITSGRWPVNSQIPTEAALAVELGVGRSTVREAVGSLARMGMLEPAPGRGTFVRSLSPVSTLLSELTAGYGWEDLLQVRAALEVRAAQLAAARAGEDGVLRLRRAHDVGPHGGGRGADARGEAPSPGQFHAVLVELADNRLLAELHGAVLSSLREGIGRGEVCVSEDDATREAEHSAILAAVAAGASGAAAGLAALHAERDLTARTHT